MLNKPVIHAQDVSLGQQGKVILTGMNLSIQQKEFIIILGPNGAGKSTFLRTLLGLIKPYAGTLRILGAKPRIGNREVGYMPQVRSTLQTVRLTARAVLHASLEGTWFGAPFYTLAEKAEVQSVLDCVQADHIADQPLMQLSGGERQRLFLAQSLLGRPRILLLDEPLANIDPHFQESFIHILKDVQEQFNTTILFTAHDPNPLLPVADRILFFAKGKCIMGPAEEIITSASLSHLYDTAIEVIQHKGRLFVLGDGPNIFGEAHPHD